MSLLSFCCLLALIGAAVAQTSPQLQCGGTVTNVALSVDNRVPGALANVVISFSTQSALAPYNTVTLSYPPGFFVPPANAATTPAISINQAAPGVIGVRPISSRRVTICRSIRRLLPPHSSIRYNFKHGHYRWRLRSPPRRLYAYPKRRRHGRCHCGQRYRYHRSNHNRLAKRRSPFWPHRRNSSSDFCAA